MNGQSGRSGRLAEILTLLVLVVSVASAASAQQTTAPPPQITGDYRLMLQQDFVADAALVRSTWLELRGDYADWGDGGRDTSVMGIVAFNIADKVELGGNFGYLDRMRSEDQVLFGDRLSSDVSNNGFQDVNVYGKMVFGKATRPWAAGFLVKFPTADEKEFLGSGAADYELFVANRRPSTKSAWIWNAAVRFTGDPDISGAGSGKTSVGAGGGLILKLSYSWSFLAEARYETRRYDGGDNYFIVMPTIDFRPTENIALRLGVGIGLADGAPNEDYSFGFVFHL
ncbi:MAG: hypothetical protein L0Z52_07405 [Acidobacteria bacterium]|nr:hypothetical protein [Acidobacteriota bacterium]